MRIPSAVLLLVLPVVAFGLDMSTVQAATDVDPPASFEVDGVGRSTVAVSGDGRYALTNDFLGLAAPDFRVDLRTGARVALTYSGFPAFLNQNGSEMTFWSDQALLPADTDGTLSLYRYNVATQALTFEPLTNKPSGWTMDLKSVSSDGRYAGFYGTNGVIADSGVFVFDTVTDVWRQPDSTMPDFAQGVVRQSNEISLSGNGRYAAWTTFATAGCTTCADVWVYDWVTQTAEQASVTTAGADVTNGNSSTPAISDDGRHVAFRSNGGGLVVGEATPAARVYVRHLDSDTTTLVTESEESEQTQYPGPAVGGAGESAVVMEMVPSTLNGTPMDLPQPVLYNLVAGTRTVITDPSGSAAPDGYSMAVRINAAGTVVVSDTTATNFVASVSPSDPPGELVRRVFATPLLGELPARLLDTRPAGITSDGQGQAGGLVTAGNTVTVQITGRQGIAADVEAVAVNITATSSAGTGYVTAYPCDISRPNASSLNLAAGRVVSNMVVTPLSASGTLCLFTSIDTHLILDATNTFPAGAAIEAVAPARFLDTRATGVTIDGEFQGAGVVAGDSAIEVRFAGRGVVPADAEAVVMNVTAVGATATGFVTVYPCGTRPTASTHNFQVGVNKPSTVFAKLDPEGDACLYVSSGVHLLADVMGYYPQSSSYTALDPARLVDTRPAGDTIDGQYEATGIGAASSTWAVTISDRGGVPAGEQTVVLNVVLVGATTNGFLTVYPCGSARPTVSATNHSTTGPANNHVLVRTGAGGKVCFFVNAAAHLIGDVEGVL